VSRAGTERILAFLGSGAIVGELSLIDGLPRSASVVAVRPAQLSFLSRAAFEEFANKHPEVYRSLLTLIAARLRETDATVAAGSFLPLRGRVACTLTRAGTGFWPRRRRRPHRHSPEDWAKRSSRHGRYCP
jgi:CRP/FNR family transcriptional regulator, cyclic AMP receptor protein